LLENDSLQYYLKMSEITPSISEKKISVIDFSLARFGRIRQGPAGTRSPPPKGPRVRPTNTSPAPPRRIVHNPPYQLLLRALRFQFLPKASIPPVPDLYDNRGPVNTISAGPINTMPAFYPKSHPYKN